MTQKPKRKQRMTFFLEPLTHGGCSLGFPSKPTEQVEPLRKGHTHIRVPEPFEKPPGAQPGNTLPSSMYEGRGIHYNSNRTFSCQYHESGSRGLPRVRGLQRPVTISPPNDGSSSSLVVSHPACWFLFPAQVTCGNRIHPRSKTLSWNGEDTDMPDLNF